MSSEHRSSSAVRNLRSIFENKSSDSTPDARGRSPAASLTPDPSEARPRSRIRSSFIAVQPAVAAMAAEQQRRESSIGARRSSMSEGHSGDALDLIKDSVGGEAERRDKHSSVADMIPEQAIESPAIEVPKQLNLSSTAPVDKVGAEPENPDKPVTGEQEEPAAMKPADPASESAVSGGEALPPVAEDLRKPAKARSTKTATSKPAAISTKKAPSNSVKSPTNGHPKTPVSSSSASTSTRPPRASLNAPTAASVARAAAADKSTSPPKPKPRESTKPVDLPSRLTAPTAATRARLGLESNDAKPAPSSRPQPKPATARPTPRPSIGRPDSGTSSNAPKKPAAPVDGSFLERMMRPTAASASKVHDKTEVKSPPRQKQLPARPKVNGEAKGAKSTRMSSAGTTDRDGETTLLDNEHAVLQEEKSERPTAPIAEAVEETVEAVKETVNKAVTESAAALEAVGKDIIGGNETPAHTNGHHEDAAALEDTPAAIGSQDSIR